MAPRRRPARPGRALEREFLRDALDCRRMRDGRSAGTAYVRAVATMTALAALAATITWLPACERPRPAAAPEPPPAPAPPQPVVRDAGPPPPDAAGDALDAAGAAAPPAKPAAAHKPAPSAEAGGGDAHGVKIEGTLPKPAVAKVVRAGAAKLRACYDKEHARNPDLHGRVTFRLTVDDRGRVPLGEVVTSTLGGGDPEMCMVEAARDFRFPAGSGDSTVSFQMSFGR